MATLDERIRIDLNETQKKMLKMPRKNISNEIWLIVWRYAPNDKKKYLSFEEWSEDDIMKVKGFSELMWYDKLKTTKVAWNKIFKIFADIDLAYGAASSWAIVKNAQGHSGENVALWKLLENDYSAEDAKLILGSYCSYVWMKKWKGITEELLSKRSRYVYDFYKLYPHIDPNTEFFALNSTHRTDLQETYANQICPVLTNMGTD